MIPVINTTQSVLGYLQWQEFTFQPYATGTPTSWTASTLPDGVTIDGSTGAISGAAEKPGVYVVAVIASNSDGASAAVVFTIGIEASSPSNGSDVDLAIDVVTGTVRLGRPAALVGAADPDSASAGTVAPAATDGIDKSLALFTVKMEDDRIFRVRFQKAGVPLDLDLTAFNFNVKEFDGDGVILQSNPTHFVRDGTGADTTYRLHVKFTGDPLASAVSNYDDDTSARFPAHGEFEWIANNPDTATIGPATVRGSSDLFFFTFARQQQAA